MEHLASVMEYNVKNIRKQLTLKCFSLNIHILKNNHGRNVIVSSQKKQPFTCKKDKLKSLSIKSD